MLADIIMCIIDQELDGVGRDGIVQDLEAMLMVVSFYKQTIVKDGFFRWRRMMLKYLLMRSRPHAHQDFCQMQRRSFVGFATRCCNNACAGDALSVVVRTAGVQCARDASI